jgi:tetratricopeptide (TPR) repeat protein
LRLGRFKDAIALVEPAYDAHPDDQAVDYILGTALIQDGQVQKGGAVIDHIMRNGNPAVANVLLGAAQYAAEDYKTAEATLQKALDANPNLPGAWTTLGRAWLGSGDTEKAKDAFRHAIEADPNDFDACLHLGGVLRHDGDTEGAKPYLEHALTLRPDSAPAQFQIFALDAATGHLEEARTGFEKLVKQWPDFIEAHIQLATVYARLHQTQQSEREQKIVVELNEKARAKGPQPEAAP